MKNLAKLGFLMCLSLATIHNTLVAAEWADRTTISGFSSAIYQQTDEHVAFDGENHIGVAQHGSFKGTRFGININSQISDRVRLASQILSSKENSDFSTKLDWAFISVSLSDSLTLRTGKVKYPVGILNEYVAVGYAYPWIAPPSLMYSLQSNGPQATREAYTGANLLWTREINDFLTSVDIFYGEVQLNMMRVHSMTGSTIKISWQDRISLQTSYYRGSMDPDIEEAHGMEENAMTMMTQSMEGEPHSAFVIGTKAEISDVLLFAEYADIDMGEFKTGKGTSWYTGGGYHINDFMPYGSVEFYEKGKNTMNYSKQYKATAGLRYDVLPNTAVKFEYSRIHTSAGSGLFDHAPEKSDVNMYGVSLDVVF